MSALEGMASVQARISELRGQLGLLTPARPTAYSGPSFQAALQSAIGTAALPQDGGVPAVVDGRLQPPPELAAYGNGRIPAEALVPIGNGSERLYGPAAEAFRRMASDAWRVGVDLKVNDGYRSIEHQHDMAERHGLYRDGGRAAVPGTSTHGWGLSVDVDSDGGAHEWLRRNAGRYGFVNDVAGEPWHWTYRAQPA